MQIVFEALLAKLPESEHHGALLADLKTFSPMILKYFCDKLGGLIPTSLDLEQFLKLPEMFLKLQAPGDADVTRLQSIENEVHARWAREWHV